MIFRSSRQSSAFAFVHSPAPPSGSLKYPPLPMREGDKSRSSVQKMRVGGVIDALLVEERDQTSIITLGCSANVPFDAVMACDRACAALYGDLADSGGNGMLGDVAEWRGNGDTSSSSNVLAFVRPHVRLRSTQ